jgi:aspartate kinase
LGMIPGPYSKRTPMSAAHPIRLGDAASSFAGQKISGSSAKIASSHSLQSGCVVRRQRIVQKFGGTSVGTLDRMRHVAEIVADEYEAGHDVVVVLSAMSGETNRLIALAESAARDPVPREMDCLLATGEQVSVALMSMILNERGIPARSVLGFQMEMRTDGVHTKARILGFRREIFEASFAERRVLVAAGFQGIDDEGDVTTLGRGGTDTTAVAIAAELSADFCDIYTDVEGVFTTDPRVVEEARLLERVSYEEMLELASLGAKVLQIRSVELAMKYQVPVRVRSTFTRGLGTLVTSEDRVMEGRVVSGISCDRGEAKIALRGVRDVPGVAAKIFTPLSDAQIVVDMIIQNMSQEGSTDLTFTVPRGDLKQAVALMQKVAGELEIDSIEHDSQIAKVSIVGVGMRSHSGVATKMFQTLAAEGINIQMISTSEIKISAVVDEKYAELAARTLHQAFGLDEESRPV